MEVHRESKLLANYLVALCDFTIRGLDDSMGLLSLMNMYLNKVTLDAFRGVSKPQEIFFEDLNTIVGRNDAGKSTLLFALDYFFNEKAASLEDLNNVSDSEDFYIECVFSGVDIEEKLKEYLRQNNKKEEGIDEEVESLLISEELTVKRSWIGANGKPKTYIKTIDYEEEKYRGLVNLSDIKISKLLKDLEVTVPADEPGRNSKLEKIKHISIELDKRGEKKDYFYKEYKKIDFLPIFEFFPADFAISTDSSYSKYFRSETGDVFEKKTKSQLDKVETEVRNSMASEAEHITEYIKEHASDIESVSIEPIFDWKTALNDVKINMKAKNDSEQIRLEYKGAGFRRLFMVARFRYLASVRSTGDTIYAIEEPETFLHPSAQTELLNSLITISEDNQVLITTHSAVFAGKTPNNSIFLTKKGAIGTEYLSKDEVTIKGIIEELGIRPSHNLVDEFEKIIFFESHHDIDFFKILCEKAGYRIDRNYLLLPGGTSSVENLISVDYFQNQTTRNQFLVIDSDIFDPDDYPTEKVKGLEYKVAKNNKIVSDFDAKDRCSGWVLPKREMENYLHPRAIERAYGLTENIIPYDTFPDTLDVETIRNDVIMPSNSKKLKNRIDIFNSMSQEEWDEVIDDKLREILETIFRVAS